MPGNPPLPGTHGAPNHWPTPWVIKARWGSVENHKTFWWFETWNMKHANSWFSFLSLGEYFKFGGCSFVCFYCSSFIWEHQTTMFAPLSLHLSPPCSLPRCDKDAVLRDSVLAFTPRARNTVAGGRNTSGTAAQLVRLARCQRQRSAGHHRAQFCEADRRFKRGVFSPFAERCRRYEHVNLTNNFQTARQTTKSLLLYTFVVPILLEIISIEMHLIPYKRQIGLNLDWTQVFLLGGKSWKISVLFSNFQYRSTCSSRFRFETPTGTLPGWHSADRCGEWSNGTQLLPSFGGSDERSQHVKQSCCH